MDKNRKSLHFFALMTVIAVSLLNPYEWITTLMVGDTVYAHSTIDPYPIPTFEVHPHYPATMLERITSLQVSLDFEINQHGEVEKPTLRNATPPGVFELSALHAVKQLEFDPKELATHTRRTISLNPLRVRGFKNYSIVISHQETPALKVPSPVFPLAALEKGITEGIVVVEFEWQNSVEKKKNVKRFFSGEMKRVDSLWIYATENPKIVFAEPRNVFEESAMEAITKVRYEFVPWNSSVHTPRPTDGHQRDPRLHRYEFSLDSKPKTSVIPTYPEEAIQHEMEGNVVVKFDISRDGIVKNPKVVYSDTPDIFDNAAIDAVSRFTYDSRHQVSSNVLHLVAFELNSDYQLLSSTGIRRRLPGLLQQEALSEILAWYIDIEFDINESGTVENARMLDSNAPNRLQRLALRHTRSAIFKPKLIEGKPTRASHLQHRYVVTPVQLNSTEDISKALTLEGFLREPIYTLHADVAGSVIVNFDVDETGRVKDPFVIESDPVGLYDELSIAMVKNFRYEPLIAYGTNVPVSNVRHNFSFSKDTDNNGSFLIHLDDGSPRFGVKESQ